MVQAVLQEEQVVRPSLGALGVQLVNPCQAALEVQPAYPTLVELEVWVVSEVQAQGVLVVLAVVRGVVAALFHHRFLQSFEFLRRRGILLGQKWKRYNHYCEPNSSVHRTVRVSEG